MSLKKFIAARGRPKTVISYNGKTFVVGAKWIRKVVRNEKLQDYLSERRVKLQLHLQSKYKNLPTSGSETCFVFQ